MQPKRALSMIVALSLLVLASCGEIRVTPAIAQNLGDTASNARAFAERAGEDPNVPAYCKQWLADDAQQWTGLSRWANGEAPQP